MCGRGFAVRAVAGLSGGGHAGAYAIRLIKDKEDHCKPIFAALFVGSGFGSVSQDCSFEFLLPFRR